MTKFTHGQIVRANVNGKTINGSIRTVTRGTTDHMPEPEYGVLPVGQLSLIAMVTVRESAVREA